MPVTTTYPGLYLEELPSTTHTIVPAPTSITVFVGYGHPFQGQVADDGAWGVPKQIFNFTEYTRLFGGFFQGGGLDTNLPDAVYQFFVNGGSNAYVVALQPKFYVVPAIGQPTSQVVCPASDSISGITFTSRQITDDANPITITVNNVRAAPADDTADIVVTFGSIVEVYRGVKTANVAAEPDPAFIANRLAGSNLVKVEPDTGTLFPASYNLAAASETLKLTDMQDETGSPLSGVILYERDFDAVFDDDQPLDKIEIFNLLVMPGVADTSLWDTALAYCTRKLAFFVMDPARTWSADETFTTGFGMDTVEQGIAAVPRQYDNGALYFPYLKTSDPITGQTAERPPSGFVAGVMARTDATRGVWKAPAGLESPIRNTTGVVDSGKMTDMRQGTLNPKGVNVLRSFPASGTVIWGARTLGTETREQWRYVPVRRMALFLEQSLLRNLGWVVFEPNDEPLWTAIRISVESFMLSLFRQGAFQGRTPSQAFAVQCDRSTTSVEEANRGIVNVVVGFCPVKPAEFVVIKISQLAGQTQ